MNSRCTGFMVSRGRDFIEADSKMSSQCKRGLFTDDQNPKGRNINHGWMDGWMDESNREAQSLECAVHGERLSEASRAFWP